MSSLQEIKTRISSIITTKKITKAMQLVATSKLKKAQINLESIQEYYKSVQDMFQELLINVKDVSKIFPQKAKEVAVYILITSDLGLCGSYNSNVYKEFERQFKNSDQLIIMGSKGVSHFKNKGQKIFLEMPNLGDNPNYEFAAKVGRNVIAQYMSGKINKVKLIYTQFINSVTFEVNTKSILPIKKFNTLKPKASVLTEFEPSAEKVLKNIIPLYVSAMLFGSTVESKVSEISSRRTAMENATDNADELIDILNLEYNRARQASITQEITEIVAGTEIE